MELQHLRCFDAVATELHFGRAALRLNVSPSPVTRAVKELERELGVGLFVREHHRVELTGAGHRLRAEVSGILARIDGLPSLVEPQPTDARRVVRVGASYLLPGGPLDVVTGLVARSCPGVRTEVVLGVSADLSRALAHGRLDLAVLDLPVRDAGLAHTPLASYPFCLAMSRDDPLAAREVVSLRDLAGRTLMMGPQDVHPALMHDLRRDLRRAGVTSFDEMPDYDVVRWAAHVEVTHGLTLALSPESSQAGRVFRAQGLALRPLAEAVGLDLGLVWRHASEDDEVVAAVVRAARGLGPDRAPADLFPTGLRDVDLLEPLGSR
jgi:DNA-binding transcriptional LysR family regulator